MKPQLFIKQLAKDRNIEDITIELCKNNIHTYLTDIQDMQNEVDSLWKDGIKYEK